MAPFSPIQEIVDLIVDHLVDDIPTSDNSMYPKLQQLSQLKRVALVSHAFASRSQKYLFCRVELRKQEFLPPMDVDLIEFDLKLQKKHEQALIRLLEILNRKPYLSAHIRCLDVCWGFGNLFRSYESISTLLNLLNKYQNPRHLTVDSEASDSNTFIPEPDFSFIELFQLRSMSISCWEKIPVSFVTSNPELQSLHISDFFYAPIADNSVEQSSSIRPVIKYLTCRAAGILLEYLVEPGPGQQSILDFSSLEYFRLLPETQLDMDSSQRLVSLVGSVLKEFIMDQKIDESGICSHTNAFSFSSCTNLRRLTLSLVSYDLNKQCQQIIDHLVLMLMSISNSDLVEKIRLELYFYVGSSKAEHCKNLRWNVFDGEISRLLGSGQRSNVAGYLYIEFWSYDEDREMGEPKVLEEECLKIAEDIREQFPLSNSHVGLIDFQIQTDVNLHYLSL